MKRLIAGIGMLAVVAGTAEAALLTNIQGPVSVNTGQGFRLVTTAVDLKPGDRVMVGNGGTAQLIYNDACITRVDGSGVVVVQQAAPCGLTTGQVQPTPGPGGVPTTVVIAGGVVIVGGGIYALSKAGGSNKPASP